VNISEEAVEAAHKAILAYKSTRGIDNQANALRAALEAAGEHLVADLRLEVLGELITDEALERSRKLIEDELIEWRDEGRFMLRNNGLAIRNRDGSGSEIIRFGFEMGLRMVINDRMAAVTGGARG
jgi:hypothetical protein